jgi:hypothetical protein
MAAMSDPTTDHALDYYRYLREQHSESTRSLTRAVMTLAGGALALSVTFVAEVVPVGPDGTRDGKGWVLTGWILLFSSLLCIVASHLSAEQAFFNAMSQLGETKPDNAVSDQGNPSDQLTGWLNAGALGCLALGLLALAVFAYTNL